MISHKLTLNLQPFATVSLIGKFVGKGTLSLLITITMFPNSCNFPWDLLEPCMLIKCSSSLFYPSVYLWFSHHDAPPLPQCSFYCQHYHFPFSLACVEVITQFSILDSWGSAFFFFILFSLFASDVVEWLLIYLAAQLLWNKAVSVQKKEVNNYENET